MKAIFDRPNVENKPLRIGLIGCGKAAEIIYCHALKSFSDIKVTAVVDPLKERTNLLSRMFSTCSSYSSICDSSSEENNFFDHIDAGIVASPPDSHIQIALELLKRDKFVLIEKPLALSMKGIDNLLEVESSSKGSIMIGFNFRYWEPVILLKDRIKNENEFGLIQINFSSSYNNWNPISFKSDVLDDLGSHVFDLINFIFNKNIVSISAKGDQKNIDMRVRISNDVSINISISHTSQSKRSIKVISKSGKYFVNLNSVRISPELNIFRKFFDIYDLSRRKLFRKTSPIKKTYQIQLQFFFDTIRNNEKKFDPGIMDGIKAIQAVEAARKSVRNNGEEIFIYEG